MQYAKQGASEMGHQDRRLLLTGVTGHSGSWLLRNIVAQRDFVPYQHFRTIIRSSSNAGFIDSCGLPMEKICGDLNNEAFLDEAMKNVDTVFHIAGIRFSLKVVQAAVRNKVKWIVLVHTTGIYSKYKAAGEGYRQVDHAVETLARDADIPLTVLRPTMIYGRISDRNIGVFIKMVDKLRIFPIVSHGRYLLQPINAKDLGTAYYQVITNEETTKGKCYNLSGKEPIMFIDILRTIGRLLGKSNVFIPIPFTLAYLLAWLLYGTSFTKLDYREKVQRLIEPRIFSHEEATRDFGFSPMSFEEGVVSEVREYQALLSQKSPA